MHKLRKEDWKTFLQIFLVINAVVLPLGFFVMGIDNIVLETSLSSKVEKAIKHFDTTLTSLADTTSKKIESLQKEVINQGKDANFLVHRNKILQEKIAKLEAKVEVLEYKLEKE